MTTSDTEELCGVCASTREQHIFSMNHEFNVEGKLIPKKKEPRAATARVVSSEAIAIRLTTTLFEKKLISGPEIQYILTGEVQNAPNNSTPQSDGRNGSPDRENREAEAAH